MNKLLPLSTSLLLLAGSASAQVEFFWDGETDGDWTDVTNWDTTGAAGGDPAAIPTAGDDANLTSAGLGSTIDLGGTAVIRNFDIQGGADDFIIGSGAVGSQTLDLSGNFVSRSGEQTVNANIELDLNKNIANRHNTKALTINGDISSSGNFKFGAAGDAGFDDGLIVVNGDVTSNGGSGNITLDGKSEQVVRFNGGTYSFNYLNVSSGTVQVVDSSLDNGGRYVLGGDTTNGTLEYVGTGDLNVTNRFDIGSLNSGDAADTGGAVFKASQTSGALTISGLHGTNNNPTGNRTLTLAGANLEDNTVSSNLKDPSDGFTSSTLSLTKADAGKWILSGNNTFTGTTPDSGAHHGVGARRLFR